MKTFAEELADAILYRYEILHNDCSSKQEIVQIINKEIEKYWVKWGVCREPREPDENIIAPEFDYLTEGAKI